MTSMDGDLCWYHPTDRKARLLHWGHEGRDGFIDVVAVIKILETGEVIVAETDCIQFYPEEPRNDPAKTHNPFDDPANRRRLREIAAMNLADLMLLVYSRHDVDPAHINKLIDEYAQAKRKDQG